MRELFRAEFRKLRWPVIAAVVVAAGVITALFAAQRYQLAAQAPVTSYAANARQIQQQNTVPVPSCAQLGLPQGSACQARRAHDEQLARSDQQSGLTLALSNLREQVWQDKYWAAAATPVGAAGPAAGLSASIMGWLVVAVLAAFVVAGEFHRGTIAAVFLAEPRRHRVLLVKTCIVFALSLLTVVSGWVFTALVLPFFAHHGHLAASRDSVGSVLVWSAGQLGRAVVVVGVYALIWTLTAVLVRSQLFTAAVALGGLAALVIVGAFSHVSTPLVWVAGWMRFGTSSLPNAFFWSSSFQPGIRSIPGAASSVLAIAVTGLVCAGISAAWVRRMPIPA